MKRAHIQEHTLALRYNSGLYNGRRRPLFRRPFSLLDDVVYANEAGIHNAKRVTYHQHKAREIRQGYVLPQYFKREDVAKNLRDNKQFDEYQQNHELWNQCSSDIDEQTPPEEKDGYVVPEIQD